MKLKARAVLIASTTLNAGPDSPPRGGCERRWSRVPVNFGTGHDDRILDDPYMGISVAYTIAREDHHLGLLGLLYAVELSRDESR